ncbi:MAG: copper resistance protein CopC [Gemmatimonadota bacterium]|nr:copper resistance protein CopC [Gemmatimonadota bacterium]
MTKNRRLWLAIALATVLSPTRAWAHAHLKRSEPAAGSAVTSSPQWIRLWFSEQPELSMTVVSMKDANGNEFALGPPQNDPRNPLAVSARVSQPLPPGRYTVAWRTAGSDGHPSHGTFSFIVLTKATLPGNGSAQVGTVADAIDSGNTPAASSTGSDNGAEANAASSLSNSLARTFTFVGLLALIGTIVFRTLILSRARGISLELRARMESRAAALGLAASALVIITALARLFLEARMMNAIPDMRTMSMTDMAMHTRWGFALRLELGAALLALVSFALAVRQLRGAWLVATIAAIILAATPALAGHAAASPKFTSLMIATDFLHVLGGASWLGSLFAIMVIGVHLSLTLDGVERWSSIASLVNSFSPTALAAAAVVVTSGLIASWVHLETFSALWQTAYGQMLLVKVLLVVITLTIGAYNFRRVQPQLVTEVGPTRLRRSAALELSVGFLILLVTGFLTGISP